MAGFVSPMDFIAPYLTPLVGQVAAGINAGANLAKIPSTIASQNAATAYHQAQIPYMQAHEKVFAEQAAKLAMQQDAEKKYLSLLTGGGDPYSNEAAGLLLQSGKDPSSAIKQAAINKRTADITERIKPPVTMPTPAMTPSISTALDTGNIQSIPNEILFPKSPLPAGRDIIEKRGMAPREQQARKALYDPAEVTKEVTAEQADTRAKLLENSVTARIDKADKDRAAREDKANTDRAAKTAKEGQNYVDDQGVSVYPNESGIGFHHEDGTPAEKVSKRGVKGKEKEESPFAKALRLKREKAGGGGNAPKAGTVIDGYKFNGGNPADKNNWTKVS
jgi:hypothetical protein